MATRYGSMATNAIIRSSFSSKLFVTSLLDAYGKWSKSGEDHAVSEESGKKNDRQISSELTKTQDKISLTNQQNKTRIERSKRTRFNY